MKVLLINTVPLEANGISTFIINSAEVMIKKGVNVTITAPNKVNSKLKDKLRKKGISIVEIMNRMRNPFHYFIELKKLLAQYNYDVVHVNGNSTTMAIELLAAKQERIKLRIAHSHNTTTEHPFVNRILRPVFEKNINGRLACNDAAGKWLFKNKKYTVIKNGIFLNKYTFNTSTRKSIREKYKISDDEILIGHVGMFNYQKNQKFLVNLLKKMDPKYKLMLIGTGPDLKIIKEYAEKKSISNRIIFTGSINNVADYLNAFDLFTLPSNFEGQPFVVIEAMASGLPLVVSTNVSREINLNDKVNFISLDKDKEWKNIIERYKFDSSTRLMNSVNSIKILKKMGYDVEWNVYNSLIPLYKELMEKSNK